MNEIAIAEFVEQTGKFIRTNRHQMEPRELASVTELCQDLPAELERQRLFDELYN